MGFAARLWLTNNGKQYLSDAQLGTELRFTKMVMGDGDIGGAAPQTITNVVSPKLPIGIREKKRTDERTVYIRGDYTSAVIEQGFYFRELGLYADKGDGTPEILYAYGNAGSLAEYIDAQTGPSTIEKVVAIEITVDNAQNVTVVFSDSALYVLKSEYEDAVDTLTAAVGGLVNAVGYFAAGKFLVKSNTVPEGTQYDVRFIAQDPHDGNPVEIDGTGVALKYLSGESVDDGWARDAVVVLRRNGNVAYLDGNKADMQKSEFATTAPGQGVVNLAAALQATNGGPNKVDPSTGRYDTWDANDLPDDGVYCCHVNVPDDGYWYVQTFRYSAQSCSQMALQFYNASSKFRFAVRVHQSDSLGWTEWEHYVRTGGDTMAGRLTIEATAASLALKDTRAPNNPATLVKNVNADGSANYGTQLTDSWGGNSIILQLRADAGAKAMARILVGDNFWNLYHQGNPSPYTRASTLVVAASDSGVPAEAVDFLCTGTNDATTIQNAINTLPTKGGDVLFLQGTYNFGTSSVVLPSRPYINLRGAGRSTIFSMSTASGYGIQVPSSAVSVEVSGIAFNMTSTGGAIGTSGTNRAKNLWVHHCQFNGSAQQTNYTIGPVGGNLIFSENHIAAGRGLTVPTGSSATIVNNIIEISGQYAILVGPDGAEKTTIAGNTIILSASQPCIYMTGPIKRGVISDNVITGGTMGIYMNGTITDFAITGNVITAFSSQGIFMASGARSNNLGNNIIRSTAGSSINLQSGANYNSVTENIVHADISNGGANNTLANNSTVTNANVPV